MLVHHSLSQVRQLLGISVADIEEMAEHLNERNDQIEMENETLLDMQAKQHRALLRIDYSDLKKHDVPDCLVLHRRYSHEATNDVKERIKDDYMLCQVKDLLVARKFLSKRGLPLRYAGDWRNDFIFSPSSRRIASPERFDWKECSERKALTFDQDDIELPSSPSDLDQEVPDDLHDNGAEEKGPHTPQHRVKATLSYGGLRPYPATPKSGGTHLDCTISLKVGPECAARLETNCVQNHDFHKSHALKSQNKEAELGSDDTVVASPFAVRKSTMPRKGVFDRPLRRVPGSWVRTRSPSNSSFIAVPSATLILPTPPARLEGEALKGENSVRPFMSCRRNEEDGNYVPSSIVPTESPTRTEDQWLGKFPYRVSSVGRPLDFSPPILERATHQSASRGGNIEPSSEETLPEEDMPMWSQPRRTCKLEDKRQSHRMSKVRASVRAAINGSKPEALLPKGTPIGNGESVKEGMAIRGSNNTDQTRRLSVTASTLTEPIQTSKWDQELDFQPVASERFSDGLPNSRESRSAQFGADSAPSVCMSEAQASVKKPGNRRILPKPSVTPVLESGIVTNPNALGAFLATGLPGASGKEDLAPLSGQLKAPTATNGVMRVMTDVPFASNEQTTASTPATCQVDTPMHGKKNNNTGSSKRVITPVTRRSDRITKPVQRRTAKKKSL